MASASDGKLMMSGAIVAPATTGSPTIELVYAFDYQPAEITYSTSSSEYYGGAINSRKSELSEGSFKTFLVDGCSDSIVGAAGTKRTFKFFPDRNVETNYITTTGWVSIQRTFPVGDQMQADVTIASDEASVTTETA